MTDFPMVCNSRFVYYSHIKTIDMNSTARFNSDDPLMSEVSNFHIIKALGSKFVFQLDPKVLKLCPKEMLR